MKLMFSFDQQFPKPLCGCPIAVIIQLVCKESGVVPDLWQIETKCARHDTKQL
jgi:hypothetical protein